MIDIYRYIYFLARLFFPLEISLLAVFLRIYGIKGHRRTGIFLPVGAIKHLPKKITQVAQIFTKESKRNEGHIATT